MTVYSLISNFSFSDRINRIDTIFSRPSERSGDPAPCGASLETTGNTLRVLNRRPARSLHERLFSDLHSFSAIFFSAFSVPRTTLSPELACPP
jgi:hypothetical protein